MDGVLTPSINNTIIKPNIKQYKKEKQVTTMGSLVIILETFHLTVNLFLTIMIPQKLIKEKFNLNNH